MRTFEVSPEDAGLPTARPEDLKGGDAETNAAAMRAMVGGERGPFRDAVIFNAAAALVVAGKAQGLAEGARACGALDRRRRRQGGAGAPGRHHPRARARANEAMTARARNILEEICADEARARPPLQARAAAVVARRRGEDGRRAARASPGRWPAPIDDRRLRPHLRDQASLAVEGADPRRLRAGVLGPRLCRRRRRLPFGADRRRVFPGRARAPRLGPRRRVAAGAAQGLHGRPLPDRRGAGDGCGLRARHPRRRRRRARPGAGLHGRRARHGRAVRGPRPRRARPGAGLRERADRHQQPRPEDAARRSGDHRGAGRRTFPKAAWSSAKAALPRRRTSPGSARSGCAASSSARR